ncbi:MAG: tryptophan 2,3-dioxygenase family protein [Oligoflexia bacterium]|nr:tryptophan 2,3-dioxygenase family protein [Oligoflexia bacterium]
MRKKTMKEYEKLELKELNYNSYLKVPELLDLQKELSTPPHHDEMFFIIIHQAAELWFKLMLHETNGLIHDFQKNSVSRALKKLKRLTRVMDLMVKQINLLNTLTPVEFAGFRDHLRPASGFQSIQFRVMEFTFGIREEFFIRFFEKEPEKKKILESIKDKKSVYDEFLACLNRNGFSIPKEILERDVSTSWKLSDELVQTIKTIYENPKENYHWVLLFESMLDFDEKFALWRSTHMLMVARTIGMKMGTGGSSGYNFLAGRAEHRFFPELWAVRTEVGGEYS